MTKNFCDLACEILRATHDGDQLAPKDLKLTELAVNGFLSEAGEVAFMELHRNATKPEGYTVPWFLGIEHMTIDHERYIYWKGVPVEHFDHSFWRQDGWEVRQRIDAEALAAKCRLLDALGITPNNTTVSGYSQPDAAHLRFPDIASRDFYLSTCWPDRECCDTPGAYECDNGAALQVCLEDVFVFLGKAEAQP